MSWSTGELDDPAQVHNGDPVGDHPGHGEVVGDKEHGHRQPAAEVTDQVEDGGGQGHVEGAGGLIAQQQRGWHHDGAGQGHPLALAAR